jgi:hypothetical protein
MMGISCAGLMGAIAAEMAYLPLIIEYQEQIRGFLNWLPLAFKAAVPVSLLAAVIAPGVYMGKLTKGAFDALNMGNVKAQELICAARKAAE